MNHKGLDPNSLAQAIETVQGLTRDADAKSKAALLIIACVAKENGGEVVIMDSTTAGLHPDTIVSTYRDESRMATVFKITEPKSKPFEATDGSGYCVVCHMAGPLVDGECPDCRH